MNASNLFDRRYISSCYSTIWCWYGAGRDVQATPALPLVIGAGTAFALSLALGAACAVAGVGLLRTAWLRRGGGWRIAAGWTLIGCGVIGWRGSGAGWDKAVALAALAPHPRRLHPS